MVVLALHGAAAAEGYDDCEGDILKRIRAIVGDKVPVGAELDLHCHITDTMVREATVLVAYKEYPHTDIPDRADELFTYVADAAEGKTRPVMAAFDCRMIGTFRTTEQPLRDYVDRMYALEGNGIISVSLGHSFPWRCGRCRGQDPGGGRWRSKQGGEPRAPAGGGAFPAPRGDAAELPHNGRGPRPGACH